MMVWRYLLLQGYAPRSLFTRAFATAIPNVVRLKELAKVLKLPHTKIVKDIALRSKKRYFCKYGDVYFQFASVNEILMPFDVARDYAAKHKKHLTRLSLTPVRSSKAPVDPKIPVVALLGHFNHGKTTLLDFMRGSNIVSIEEHGITQVLPHSHYNLMHIGSAHEARIVDRTATSFHCCRHSGTGDLLSYAQLWYESTFARTTLV